MPKGCYPRKSIKERFWSNVKLPPAFALEYECWEWIGNKNRGYGTLSVNGKKTLAHRIMYSWHDDKFPLNSKYHVDHLCFNRSCVNPTHLSKATHRENVKRSKKQSSDHVGIYWHKTTKRWRAVIQLGSFMDKVEAKSIYDKVSKYLESMPRGSQPSSPALSGRSTLGRKKDLKCS